MILKSLYIYRLELDHMNEGAEPRTDRVEVAGDLEGFVRRNAALEEKIREVEAKLKEVETENERLRKAAVTKGPNDDDNSSPGGIKGGGVTGRSNENSMLADTVGAANKLGATDAQYPSQAKAKAGRLIFAI